MSEDETFIYSPFSRATVWDEKNRSLLMQFILIEVFLGISDELLYLPPRAFFPFDWSHETGRMNKVEEHLTLLPLAFPHLKKEVLFALESLKTEDLPQIFSKLRPFLLACHEIKHLSLFLEKHLEHVGRLCSYEELLIEMNSKRADA